MKPPAIPTPVIVLVFLLVPLAAITRIPFAHAAGTVFVDPSNTNLLNTGDTFTVSVSVSNIDPFNGWDVMVQTDSAVVNATSVSIVGNALQASELARCINGVGVGCRPTAGDGPGVVHSAAAAFGQPQVNVNGFLFTITYKVLSETLNYSLIHLENVQISNGTTTYVTVTTVDGSYGSQTPQPDFSISASNTIVNVTQGMSVNVLVTLTGLNGISDNVNLDPTSSINGVGLSMNPSSVPVADGQSSTSVLTINTTLSTPVTLYTVVVTGSPTSSRSHSVSIGVNVQRPGYFVLDVKPSLLLLHAHDSGTSTVIVASQQGFSGTIQLSVGTRVPGLTVSLRTSTLTLSPGRNASTTLTVQTPPSSITFSYIITLNATQGGVLHSLQIFVSPPASDIGFTISAPTLSLKAGTSSTLPLTLASKDYFKGIVYLLAASPSGIRLSFSPSRVYFSYTNSTLESESILTVSIDSSAPPGNNYIVLTAIGGTISRSTNMTLMVQPATTIPSTSNLATPKTIFGLQPLVYFGILAAFGVVLTFAALRELRRPKKRRFILEDA